jgi:hypothetical protein
MPISQFSFTKPGTDPSTAKFARDRQIAEALAQQSLTADPTQMVGNYAIRQTALNPLAKIAQALASRKIAERADTGEREYQQQMGQDRARMIAEAMRAGQGQEARPAIEAPPEELGGGPGRPDMPAQAPDPARTYMMLAGASDPALQGVGLQGMLSSMAPKAPIKARPGDVFLDPNNPNRQLGAVPSAPNQQKVSIPDGKGGERVGFVDMTNPNPMSTFVEAGAQPPKAEILPSGQAINPFQVQPGQIFNDPNKLMGIGPDGRPLVNQPLVDVKGRIAERGAPRTSVSVNTDKTMFSGAAGEVGKSLGNAADNARAAVGTINTVGQILQALDSGKVIAGPGTTARQFLGQVGQTLGIAGKDATDQLTQTRQAIQGLAQLELDAAQQMKGQGQITEAERSIIRRAASGDIDSISIPELRMLMGGLDKVARFKISSNQRNVELLRQQPGAGALPQFMDVPMPPTYQPQQQQPSIPPPPAGFQVVR